MSAIEAALIALAPSIAKLVELAMSDKYDAEAELQAMLNAQRAIADHRVQRLLAERVEK